MSAWASRRSPTGAALNGLGMVCVAAFSHAPAPMDEPVKTSADAWHSRFAGLVGTSFVALAIAGAFGPTARRER